uniref:Ovule protein n=1 Tax=Heterorhabditis bacteriophora TaxID=37862 RepID=A0A1I7X159_HETBA
MKYLRKWSLESLHLHLSSRKGGSSRTPIVLNSIHFSTFYEKRGFSSLSEVEHFQMISAVNRKTRSVSS